VPKNSQFTVATHILTLLAVADRSLTSGEISHSVNTNPVVVRRIIGSLQQAGLVKTSMGIGGGSKLTRRAAEITLLEVYRATQQGSILTLHNTPPNPECPVGANIQDVLVGVFDDAQQALEQQLSLTTIADLAGEIFTRMDAANENPNHEP
jgi:Rrf2 family protein